MKNKWRILVSMLLAFCITLGCAMPITAADTDNSTDKVADSDFVLNQAYKKYSSEIADYEFGEEKALTVKNIVAKSKGAKVSKSVEGTGMSGVIIPDDGYATWKFSVKNDCKYVIKVTYITTELSSGNMEYELNIDGKIPFSNVQIVSFERLYEQAEGEFKTNVAGNHLKPEVKEIKKWQTKAITDSSGYVTEPFVFGFNAGSHKITLKGSRGVMAINKIELIALEKLPTYKEYVASLGDKANEKADVEDKILEAEYFNYKSSVTILPSTDRSSAATTPQSPSALLLNTMGGSNWKSIGNSATWNFNIEKAGMYEISTRFLQNTKDGIFTCRKLYIDGTVPFEEANSVQFNYASSWQCQKLGTEKETFSFYLDEGPHTLTLEVTSGDVAEIIDTVATSINELNRIDRNIKMITGNKVDVNRDYNFAALIPDEISGMAAIAKDLQSSVDNINKLAGTNGSFVSIIQKLIFQLEKMSSNPRTIAKYLSRFQSNLGSLGEWLLSATEQPLELDKIYIQPKDNATPKANAGFFKSLWFGVESFFCTYVTDYSTIGSVAPDTKNQRELTVWVQTGRDQGQVVRELIDATFAKENPDINVKLQVVASGLLQSVLAGISPDAVCDCAETIPLEYALRNAVVDLTEFPDFEEVFSRFSKASYKPASFNGATYGMPQTFSYLMMFYRTDLFEEFGYELPKTWTELCEMIPSMQRNGMEVGMPHTLNVYTTILYQNGGKLYKNNGAKTNLSDYTSIVAFNNLTEFFTLYDCPVTYNFANRFRSGEIPLAIAPYTEYNQLTAFAPEIKGAWKMVPIPGTEDENGNMNNVSVGTSSFLVIMKSSKNKEDAWKFLKWYTSTEVQSSYAIQMESILGTCAKVASANTEALSQMTWSSSEYKELFAQMENIDSIPQYPGSYYLDRIVNFAFNRVYNKDENPKEVVSDYIKELNEELSRKRAEFGLEDGE